MLSLTQPLTASLRLPSAVKLGKIPAPAHSSGPHAPRIYIHATLGDALSADELAAEATAARRSVEALQSKPSPLNTTPLDLDTAQPIYNANDAGTGSPTSAAQHIMQPSPRGFDRLASAGFSAQEIASLRSQFLAIVAHTHTPDTMPSAVEMRMLEERWLDNDASGLPFGGASEDGGATGLAGGGGGGVGEEAGRGLDDMRWGNVIGFFWPVGAGVWLLREEGVWSKRRQIAVLTGVFINICISVLRAAG